MEASGNERVKVYVLLVGPLDVTQLCDQKRYVLNNDYRLEIFVEMQSKSGGSTKQTNVGMAWRRELSNIALVIDRIAVGLFLSVSGKGLL